MLLLTGGTGLVGRALRARLLGTWRPVRCLGVSPTGDVFLTLLERMALLPVVAISGSGRALLPPIWARPEADLRRPRRDLTRNERCSLTNVNPLALIEPPLRG